LKAKRRQKEEEAMHIEDTQRLVAEEIEMLKVVLYLVCRNRGGDFIRFRKERDRGEKGTAKK
jgi:hypothetical protein